MVLPLLAAAGATTALNVGTAIWKARQDAELAREKGEISEAQALALEDALAKYEAGYQLPPGEAPKLSAVELELMGKYSPDIYQHAVEKAPQMLPEGGLGRDAQINALNKLGAMSVTGEDAISRAAQSQAQFQAAAANKQRQQQILSEYANRGLLTGATGIAAQLSGAQDIATQQEQAALQAAAQAQSRRMEALSQYGNTAGQIRQSDDNVSRANAEIMNAFNQRFANSLNDYNKFKSAQLNEAQLANLRETQRINDANRMSAVNTANQNAINQFNANVATARAKNELGAEKLKGRTNVANLRAGGQATQAQGLTEARTGMVGNVVGALTSGIGQGAAAFNSTPNTADASPGTNVTAGQPWKKPTNIA